MPSLVGAIADLSVRVQVRNNHIRTQSLCYSYYYPKPKNLIIGYLDPLGMVSPRVRRYAAF